MIGGRNKNTRLLKKKNVFQGTINGVAGIWQRPKQGEQSGGGFGITGESGFKLLVSYATPAPTSPVLSSMGLSSAVFVSIYLLRWINY